MNKKAYQKLVDEVRALPVDTIQAAARRCDGHTIFKPEAFLKDGLPQPVVGHFTRRHRCDGSPKGMIFVNGEPVKELAGVYGLDLLRFLARALGVEYRDALGRGSEARNIRAALDKHLTAGKPARP